MSLRSHYGFSYSLNENPSLGGCCLCCCNSVRKMALESNYCYGLRQSSLIQWSSYRKLVLGGFDPRMHTRVSAYDFCRSCCFRRERLCYLRDRVGIGRKERLRRIMVFEERNESEAEEAEIMLSLLTGSVDLNDGREGRRVARIRIEEEEENQKVGRNKVADAEFLKELASLRKQEKKAALKKENSTRRGSSSVSARGRVEERKKTGVLIREVSQRNEEYDDEEEEEMEFVEEKRWTSRKDGASCSYASKGDHESDDESLHREEKYLEDSYVGHQRDSVSTEVVLKAKEDKIHEDRRREYNVGVSKESSGKHFVSGSSSVESNFRKKSEKKLTDVSVEEIDSRLKSSEKDSKPLIDQECVYEIKKDSITYDERKDKSARMLRADEGKKQLRNQTNDAVSVDSEKRLKYKQLANVQGTESVDVKKSHGFQESAHHERNNVSTKVSSSSHEEKLKGNSNLAGIATKDEHGRSSIQVGELSEIQKITMSKTSISHQTYETNTSKVDKHATFSSSQNDAKKQQVDQAFGMTISGKKSQSKTQNNSHWKQADQTIKLEKVDVAYGSAAESELYFQGYAGRTEIGQSIVVGSDELSLAQFHKEDVEGGVGASLSLEQISVLNRQEGSNKSAMQVEKSSTSKFVDEYITQAAYEASSSETKKETKGIDLEIFDEDQQEQQITVQHTSGNSQSDKHYSEGDDSSSGVEGPSVEMWKEQESSVIRQSEAETQQDDKIKTGNELAKRNGRNLWIVLGDFFRLKWFPQSDGNHSGRKSERRSPPTQSVASEAWFSSQEVEETGEASSDNGGRMVRHRREKTQFQVGEGSSPSTSDGLLKNEKFPATTESPAVISSLPSPGETLGGSVGYVSSVVISDSSTPSPSSRRSPVIQGVGEVDASDNGSRRLSTGSAVKPESISHEGKLKRGMLQRADQIQRDRFDDWEDAYRLESEQRKIDEMFMKEALLEAQKAADRWEVPVGAVLVHNKKIIARGCNLVEELRDSTAHAEMICIREASNLLRTWRLSETILYVTLEPCPMCAGAMLQARIDTVVWGAPNKLLGADGSWIRLFPNGGNGLENSEKPPAPVHPFHPKIMIRRGVLGPECADTMQQFFKLRRKKKTPPSPQTSCLPVPHRHSNILTKMHHAFTSLNLSL